MKQETFTDIEYRFRRKKNRREDFLEIMDKIIPWDEWIGVIAPYYSKGEHGRSPMSIEKMLRIYLLQIWLPNSVPDTDPGLPIYLPFLATPLDFSKSSPSGFRVMGYLVDGLLLSGHEKPPCAWPFSRFLSWEIETKILQQRLERAYGYSSFQIVHKTDF